MRIYDFMLFLKIEERQLFHYFMIKFFIVVRANERLRIRHVVRSNIINKLALS